MKKAATHNPSSQTLIYIQRRYLNRTEKYCRHELITVQLKRHLEAIRERQLRMDAALLNTTKDVVVRTVREHIHHQDKSSRSDQLIGLSDAQNHVSYYASMDNDEQLLLKLFSWMKRLHQAQHEREYAQQVQMTNDFLKRLNEVNRDIDQQLNERKEADAQLSSSPSHKKRTTRERRRKKQSQNGCTIIRIAENDRFMIASSSDRAVTR